jgi:hypothetical protein
LQVSNLPDHQAILVVARLQPSQKLARASAKCGNVGFMSL